MQQSTITAAQACVLIALLSGLVSAQLPEPNCNTNRYEGNEVWSSVANAIGQGSGPYWWGQKVSSTAAPVSWLDMCAQRLEACQADAGIPGSLSGFKPTCVCDMWSCLNRQPVADASLQPPCQFMKPQLLSFYCSAARFMNATCAAPAYVPLPPGALCSTLPSEGFTFDDIPGDGIRIPTGYQGLSWENWFMLDGDGYQVQNGYYAGVISSPKVAFNGYGYPASFSAPENGLLTLHSLYVTSAWDEENIITITAADERGDTLGTYVTSLNTETPRYIDFDSLTAGAKVGTFKRVKTISIRTSATQVALDNLHITLESEAGRTIVLPPMHTLEFYPAPPGASAPMRKPHGALPSRNVGTMLPMTKEQATHEPSTSAGKVSEAS